MKGIRVSFEIKIEEFEEDVDLPENMGVVELNPQLLESSSFQGEVLTSSLKKWFEREAADQIDKDLDQVDYVVIDLIGQKQQTRYLGKI